MMRQNYKVATGLEEKIQVNKNAPNKKDARQSKVWPQERETSGRLVNNFKNLTIDGKILEDKKERGNLMVDWIEDDKIV